MIFKDKQWNIVLEERKNYPHGIALPGWFVNYGEDPKDAIVREIQEETWATVRVTKLIGVYGDPHRDPRAHNVTIVYEWTYISWTIKSWDDAKKIVKMKPNLQSLKKYSFVCDHKKILTDYLRMK
jgi:8-oxo-dGTP diphosphatase